MYWSLIMFSSPRLLSAALLLALSTGSVQAQTINPCHRPPTLQEPEEPSQHGVERPNGLCPTGDCVDHDLSTQDECAMFEHAPAHDARWASGLSLSTDTSLFREQNTLGWNISAYRIRWSNGAWSNWYVAGVNDIDHKYNPHNRTMRRMWSYFTDHEHQALACRARQ
jgi:hypothetical protein